MALLMIPMYMLYELGMILRIMPASRIARTQGCPDGFRRRGGWAVSDSPGARPMWR